MKTVHTRRISQTFFFVLFVWFCIVSTVGTEFWRMRNWPVNLFLWLDPLAAIGTALTTHSLYKPLLWALLTLVLTIIFGRFFCSWVCPFGSLHHFVGFLGNRKKNTARRVELNKYRKAQGIKYLVLVFFLAMAAFPSWAATLQSGLLDPIPLVTRSFNLVLLAVFDRSANIVTAGARYYQTAWLIFAFFLAAVLLNLVIPRFYCRFICPLGALFGLVSRFSLWRIGKNQSECRMCRLCEKACEGGCEPSGNIKISECVLCFNCLDPCPDEIVRYQAAPSRAGEVTNPDISRRGFALSLVSGVFAVPVLRLGNKLGANWYHKVIRPPGALPEEEFLKRCIKCGQCMRVCPTNVLQPAGIDGGLEGLWTPVLNNRIGSSGCQLNCIACSEVCPTAAIRPISLDEKLGTGPFEAAGPIKLGIAFVDRNRCLPWAMDKPCIVCQENCPVSPKAIYTRTDFVTIRDGILTVEKVVGDTIEFRGAALAADKLATGDYYCLFENGRRVKITANSDSSIEISAEKSTPMPVRGGVVQIQVRLQRPYVDIERCIGCGVCEHECPVSGLRGIRVSAEDESRSSGRKLLLR